MRKVTVKALRSSRQLLEAQERMRTRIIRPPRPATVPVHTPARSVQRPTPKPPIDYRISVGYTERAPFVSLVDKINGVYLLHERGAYYIGESRDVLVRINGHRFCVPSQNVSGMDNPRGVVLAEIPLDGRRSYERGKMFRLIAERRFMAAAMAMGLHLTNKNVRYPSFAHRAAVFVDLTVETARLKQALDHLKLC